MTPSRWLVFAMVATAALTACGSPGYSEPEGACSAAAEWPAWLAPNPGHDGLDRDGLPTTVGGTDDCTFNKFAWQDFLALMRPQDDGGSRSLRAGSRSGRCSKARPSSMSIVCPKVP